MQIEPSRLVALALATFIAAADPARSDSVGDFYKSRTINYFLATTAGGSWDVYLRVLINHWVKHIPGNPAIVVTYVRTDGGIFMRTVAIVTVLLAGTAAAQAAEINAFISTAIKTATDELLPPFERANGYTIRASYAPSGALIPRFDRGEPVDVFLTDSAAIDELIKRGKVMADRTDLARTGIGIAVRKGAPKPDVSSAAALKRALLEAKTVGHAAPSGGSITAAHIQGVFQRLSIAAEVTPKVKLAAGGPNGRVSVLVSSGEAEIGLQQVSELMSNPEVEVIGMLPAELQQITIYSAGVTTSASEAAAAKALITALTAPSAAPIYRAKGLDPAW